MEENEKYGKESRKEGAGPYRINRPLDLTYDLYSMLFVSVVNHEYVWKWHLKRLRKDDGKDVSDVSDLSDDEGE